MCLEIHGTGPGHASNLEMRLPYGPDVKEATHEVLSEVASSSRVRILACIERGVAHPDAIAHELQLSRTAVDPHLTALVRIGILRRHPVPSQGNKPRIHFLFTDVGPKLLEDLEAAVETHRLRLRTAAHSETEALEAEFLRGGINEDELRQRRSRLQEKWKDVFGLRSASR